MRQAVQYFLIPCFAAWLLSATVEQTCAGNPDNVAQLRSALAELDTWIGPESNGDKWRTFLKTDSLLKLISEGNAADPAEVAAVLQQYRSGANGLDKLRFVAVRRALEKWLIELQLQFSDDPAKLVWAVRGDHVPVSDERFANVRSKLHNQARALEKMLGKGSKLASGWKRYLHWELLEPHFQDDVVINRQSLQNLDRVLKRFRADHAGLEMPEFTRCADALADYRELAFWYALATRRDTRPIYRSSMDKLGQQLTRHAEGPTVETARLLGKSLGLIWRLDHSPQVVQALRDQLAQPNFFAHISEPVLQQLGERPVTESQLVRDVILGAQVRGNAMTHGFVSIQTIPAKDHIEIEVQLSGEIHSKTTGFKKPVCVSSKGHTCFIATKRLRIDDDQFELLPTEASASTHTQIGSICKTGGKFGRRLIERIAHKKVYESKAQSERIASKHAKRKVKAKFDRQISQAIHEAREKYDDKFRAPLLRNGMFPEHLLFATNEDSVSVEATVASHQQISANSPPPEVTSPSDLTMRLHESAVNNFLPVVLGGAGLRQDIASEPPRLEGDIPAWVKEISEKQQLDKQAAEGSDPGTAEKREFKPWYFKFNNEHPASISFDDGQLTLRLRIAELKASFDEEERPLTNWDFLIVYDVVQENDGIVLRRAGEIEALPTGFDPRWDKKLSGEQVGIRNNLAKNLNKRSEEGEGFPKEITVPPLKISSAAGTEYAFLLQDLVCADGWLTIGYRLP